MKEEMNYVHLYGDGLRVFGLVHEDEEPESQQRTYFRFYAQGANSPELGPDEPPPLMLGLTVGQAGILCAAIDLVLLNKQWGGWETESSKVVAILRSSTPDPSDRSTRYAFAAMQAVLWRFLSYTGRADIIEAVTQWEAEVFEGVEKEPLAQAAERYRSQ